MHDRPTNDPREVVLDSFDVVWSQLGQRLEGLGTDEYLWEPVAGVWSVRRGDGGSPIVEGAGEREIEPAPVTTIAWRLWHIAVDALDSYSERLLGATGAVASGDSWYLEAEPALADLERAWRCFRDGLGARSAADWWEPVGEQFGPFAQHSVYDLALHAHVEVSHHGAEIALLRDLYRSR